MVCDNHQSVSQQRAQFTRSRRSIPDGERCATDLSLARQLYSTIFTLQAGTIGPGCPSGTDKINHTATLYTLNFSQWSLPIMELSVYKGTCQLINPSPGMVTGQTLHGDTTFWNLLDRMS